MAIPELNGALRLSRGEKEFFVRVSKELGKSQVWVTHLLGLRTPDQTLSSPKLENLMSRWRLPVPSQTSTGAPHDQKLLLLTVADEVWRKKRAHLLSQMRPFSGGNAGLKQQKRREQYDYGNGGHTFPFSFPIERERYTVSLLLSSFQKEKPRREGVSQRGNPYFFGVVTPIRLNHNHQAVE